MKHSMTKKRNVSRHSLMSTHQCQVGKEVSKFAKEVNKHRHTKTCPKHNSTCRFIYPKYPSPHIIVVVTCQEKNTDKQDELLAKYHMLLRKVKTVLEEE